MTHPKRGRGRPPLAEGDERTARARFVKLPPDLDEAAARVKGQLGWSEWLRGLVEREVGGRSGPLEAHHQPAQAEDGAE